MSDRRDKNTDLVRCSLSTIATEESEYRVAASSLLVLVLLQGPVAVLDGHFFLFNDQIAGDKRSRYFPAVCTVAEMTSRLGEEFIVLDGHVDAAAKTVAGK